MEISHFKNERPPTLMLFDLFTRESKTSDLYFLKSLIRCSTDLVWPQQKTMIFIAQLTKYFMAIMNLDNLSSQIEQIDFLKHSEAGLHIYLAEIDLDLVIGKNG